MREAIEKIIASGLYVSEARVKEYVKMYLGGPDGKIYSKRRFEK